MSRCWVNGTYSSEAWLSDRGLLLGDGFFDTLLVQNSVPLFVEDHWDRLLIASQLMKIRFPYTFEEWLHQILDCPFSSFIVRTTVTRGTATGRGLSLTNSGGTSVMIKYDPYHCFEGGSISAQISKEFFVNHRSPLSMIKRLDYSDVIMALSQAQEQGFDDVILCNGHSSLSGFSTGNLWLIHDSEVWTPPLSQGCKDGIIRRVLMRDSRFIFQEKVIDAESLRQASGVLKTNSVVGVVPVFRVQDEYFDPENSLGQALREAYVEAQEQSTRSFFDRLQKL